ncbi:membrane protein [Dissulfurispira thermophila]|uniref:Membrane protein n=1 Tax=Dissulfurispira thermophila TaxID=2715679 RepID=A0A7G1H375_9BACT|nr:M23 family metallopeptidase [Dissulfurispira thermophila]BCB96396.1 membrane protein [Dissulfurispira thermophila]
MYKLKRFIRRLFTPVTIMLIPHDSKRTINVKLPSIGVVSSVVLWLVGSIYVISIAIDTIEYYNMKSKLNFYMGQFVELRTTISLLEKAEAEFKRLLSFKSRDKILENVDTQINVHDAGSLDMDLLKDQIKNTVEKVAEIQQFLKNQKDIYISTPKGWPVIGRITSEFGPRENPRYGGQEFHSGLDISAATGTPVRATADGIVSFAGWSAGNGNLVVVEHGFGYSTFYAHNSSIAVKVGQKVKRGDTIAYVGSTGNTTGPHLHYEVWHNGKAVNPVDFLKNG